MHDFVVVAPPYSSRSGGVMVLHDLCQALNRSGFRAGMVFVHGGNAQEQNFQYAISNDPAHYREGGDYCFFKDNKEALEAVAGGTVIYPDLVVGNPLGAAKVVRYVLNFNASDFAGDFVLAFSKIYTDRQDHVLFKPFHYSGFSSEGSLHWTQRTLDLTYIGKGEAFTDCHRLPGTILVERDYPRDKEQLALLLRQCRFFYSWDCVSATNIDALMCGAVPVLLHDKQISRAQINQMEIGKFPHVRFDTVSDLPAGLQYDPAQVDADMKVFGQNYRQWADSWDLRVKEFAQRYLELKSGEPAGAQRAVA